MVALTDIDDVREPVLPPDATPLMTQSGFTVTPDDISALLQNELLNPSTTLYNSARVIDSSGKLIAIVTANASAIASISRNQSDTVAFRAAANELLQFQGVTARMEQRAFGLDPAYGKARLNRGAEVAAKGAPA